MKPKSDWKSAVDNTRRNKEMPQDCIYRSGTKVMKRSERSQVGIILGEGQRIAGEYWYSVFFGGGYEKKVPESDLEPFEGAIDVDTLLRRGSFDRKETLSKIVTYTKLSTPLRNTVYSFYASRTTFYPFQFKPLVKFLDSPKQRLLIADEVGLGKRVPTTSRAAACSSGVASG